MEEILKFWISLSIYTPHSSSNSQLPFPIPNFHHGNCCHGRCRPHVVLLLVAEVQSREGEWAEAPCRAGICRDGNCRDGNSDSTFHNCKMSDIQLLCIVVGLNYNVSDMLKCRIFRSFIFCQFTISKFQNCGHTNLQNYELSNTHNFEAHNYPTLECVVLRNSKHLLTKKTLLN